MLFDGSTTFASKTQGPQELRPSMRIRFSRQNHSLELAKYMSDLQGEEWTKKMLPSISAPPYISTGEWRKLEQVEKDAVHHLTRFVRLCEASEGLINEMYADITSTGEPPKAKIPTSPTMIFENEPRSLNTTIANSLSAFTLAPRPPKLSTITARSAQLDKDIGTPIPQETASNGYDISTKGTRTEIDPAWCDGDFELTRGLDMQTRFIPSVGWCIRYGSRVSQGGRYRIMFLDGVTFEIDVDEDWVEFKGRSGETSV